MQIVDLSKAAREANARREVLRCANEREGAMLAHIARLKRALDEGGATDRADSVSARATMCDLIMALLSQG